MYVNKLNLVTNAFDEFMLRPTTSPELHANLMHAIINTTKRLYSIDTYIAKSIVVKDFSILNEDELF
ncbi:hypothetical protein CVT91_09385 [Candidatus Atribacteria bacterium HGW-Atribacteria-1]|nr:MAG: hypothetical protein CVT91_09385 [Candidatus Atribacteria bacterium HGW-Atribacteria-1]